MKDFFNFLESIETSDNKLIVDHIKNGYKVFMESAFPDGFVISNVSKEDEISSLDRHLDEFNGRAAQNAANMGLDTLMFLRNSAKSRENAFSKDTEYGLDDNPTTIGAPALNPIGFKSGVSSNNFKENDLGYSLAEPEV
jgi:hypothetical protein